MRPEGLVLLALGAALFTLAVRGSWVNFFPTFVSSVKPGDCPQGYEPNCIGGVSGVLGYNFCVQAGTGNKGKC